MSNTLPGWKSAGPGSRGSAKGLTRSCVGLGSACEQGRQKRQAHQEPSCSGEVGLGRIVSTKSALFVRQTDPTAQGISCGVNRRRAFPPLPQPQPVCSPQHSPPAISLRRNYQNTSHPRGSHLSTFQDRGDEWDAKTALRHHQVSPGGDERVGKEGWERRAGHLSEL